MILVTAATGSLSGAGSEAQNSGAANTVFAADSNSGRNAADEQAGAGSGSYDGSLLSEAEGADAYQFVRWRKADLYEYDDDFSLTKYEAASTESEDPLTTTAVSTEEDSEETTTDRAVTTESEPVQTAISTICAEPDSVIFYTSGYGHGLGMSQNGANFYARYDGWTYDQILSYYYPGTYLVQTGTPETELMTVGGKTDTVVNILSEIINNEMGSTFSEEAMKAQAIAAYSYYLYNGYGAGMICKPNPDERIVEAVKSVLGVVVYYNGAPALTMFSASSGGATASAKDVLYQDIPYLVSLPVRHDSTVDPHYNSAKVFSAAALKFKLQSVYGVQLSGGPSDWIQLEYGDGGYVSYATIGGTVRVKGNELRSVLGLKSPKFTFTYQSGTAPASVPSIWTDYHGVAPASVPHAEVITQYTTPVQTTTTTTADTTTSVWSANNTTTTTTVNTTTTTGYTSKWQ